MRGAGGKGLTGSASSSRFLTPMRHPVAAVFCMPEEGHLRRLLPIIAGLSRRGVQVHVYTHARFEVQVVGAGGRLIDIFSRYPIAAADDESRPVPCRYVSFAGHFGADIVPEVRALAPGLVIADSFAVIGRVVATALDVPLVNVCAGHNVDPERFMAVLADDPRVAVAPACHRAVQRLRDVHGLEDASPFSYVSGLSRTLNIYSEPSAWLKPAEQKLFEPMAFFGSLPSIGHIERRRLVPDPPYFPADARRRIYVSFGTVVWRYYAREALAALGAIADAVAAMPDAAAVISFGGTDRPVGEARLLERANVQVQTRVDQWAILGQAELFVTHHGLNSTHEAIFHQVPMVSCPFFWDQPSLAARCGAFGLAAHLSAPVRETVTADQVTTVLEKVFRERGPFQARLAEARQWELDTMATRPAVLDRIVALLE